MPSTNQLDGEKMLASIKARRSVREHAGEPLPPEVLDSLLDAARWAPSGGNRQPWCFVVVRDALRLRKVAAVSPGLLGNPAALVAFCVEGGDASGRSRDLDEVCSLIETGMAAQNLMLAAAAFGVGSCPIVSVNVQAVGRLLGLPDQVTPALIVTLGYPARAVEAPPQRPAQETVHWERYTAPTGAEVV